MMTLNCKKVKRGIKRLKSLIQFDANGKKNPRSLDCSGGVIFYIHIIAVFTRSLN